MDIKYINPFIQSVYDVFNKMIFLETVRENPYIKKNGDPIADISSTIGIAGKANGVIAVTFDKNTACKVAGNFLGEKFSAVNDIVKDSIAEISNIITGGAKKYLQSEKIDFKIAIPSIVVARDHTVYFPKGIPCIVIPFYIKDLNTKFFVEVCLQIKK